MRGVAEAVEGARDIPAPAARCPLAGGVVVVAYSGELKVSKTLGATLGGGGVVRYLENVNKDY